VTYYCKLPFSPFSRYNNNSPNIAKLSCLTNEIALQKSLQKKKRPAVSSKDAFTQEKDKEQ
jgi:hypothetical protein